MVDFSGVAVTMQKLNKKFKKAQQNLCKSLEKLFQFTLPCGERRR